MAITARPVFVTVLLIGLGLFVGLQLNCLSRSAVKPLAAPPFQPKQLSGKGDEGAFRTQQLIGKEKNCTEDDQNLESAVVRKDTSEAQEAKKLEKELKEAQGESVRLKEKGEKLEKELEILRKEVEDKSKQNNAAGGSPSARPVLPVPDGTPKISICTDFVFTLVPHHTKGELVAAIARYKESIFEQAGNLNNDRCSLCVLIVQVDQSNVETDESYELVVPAPPIDPNQCPAGGLSGMVTAKTKGGALRALETFSQLVFFDLVDEQYAIKGVPWRVATGTSTGNASSAIAAIAPAPPTKASSFSEQILEWRKKSSKHRMEAHPPILPAPQQFSNGSQTVFVCTDFNFDLVDPPPKAGKVLVHAFDRYKRMIFERPGKVRMDDCSLCTLKVQVQVPRSALNLETDESYALELPAAPANSKQCPPGGLSGKVTAKTQVGALRALETFSQLVSFDPLGGVHVINNAPWAIKDAPRFPHREVMLDTARHYLPARFLKATIRAIAMAKFNVFHWHITDGTSFPLNFKRYPLFSKQEAFSPAERYTQEEVKDVVEYGRLHGVRVVPELDMPGHAQSWCRVMPDLCPREDCIKVLSPIRPTKLTPHAANTTFEVASAFFDELTQMFSDQFLHFGADEMEVECWDSTPRVKAWLEQNKMTSAEALRDMMEYTSDLVRSKSRSPMVWEEGFKAAGRTLGKDVVVQVWRSNYKLVQEIARAGLRVVIHNEQYLYLTNVMTMWEHIWQKRPCVGLSDAECDKVLGMAAGYWGERLDAATLEQRMWPRLAALGELLWTGPRVGERLEFRDFSEKEKKKEGVLREKFRARLYEFRCLLLRRGVAAMPVDLAPGTKRDQGPIGPPQPASCLE